jgi:hypothetical protein
MACLEINKINKNQNKKWLIRLIDMPLGHNAWHRDQRDPWNSYGICEEHQIILRKKRRAFFHEKEENGH